MADEIRQLKRWHTDGEYTLRVNKQNQNRLRFSPPRRGDLFIESGTSK